MAQFIPLEQRAKIVSSIKDEGMDIIDAAKSYGVSEKTIRKWLRKQSNNAHTSSTEVQRLRQRVQELHILVGELMEMQRKKKSGIFGP